MVCYPIMVIPSCSPPDLLRAEPGDHREIDGIWRFAMRSGGAPSRAFLTCPIRFPWGLTMEKRAWLGWVFSFWR